MLCERQVRSDTDRPAARGQKSDGWINWSGLATLLAGLAFERRRVVDRLLRREPPQ
jgi:hypothetical protein